MTASTNAFGFTPLNIPPPLPPLPSDTNTYVGNSPSGESTGAQQPTNPNYTPSTDANALKQASLAAIQQDRQNQQSQAGATQSPYGISPQQAGSIASKAFNTATGQTGPGTFSNQIASINNWGANNLGLAGASTTGGISNAALDAGFGGTEGSLASGATGGLSNAALDAGFGGGTAASTGVDAAALNAPATLSGVLGAGAIGAIGGGLLAGALGENKLG